MKKILLILSMLMILMSFSVALAEEQQVAKAQPSAAAWYHNNVIFTKGQITEINENSVRVEGEGGYRDIVLHISPTTQIVNAEDGSPVALASRNAFHASNVLPDSSFNFGFINTSSNSFCVEAIVAHAFDWSPFLPIPFSSVYLLVAINSKTCFFCSSGRERNPGVVLISVILS